MSSKKKRRVEPAKEPLHESVAEARGRPWVLPFDLEYEFQGADHLGDDLVLRGAIHEDCADTEELAALDNRDTVTILYDKETKALYRIETPGDYR